MISFILNNKVINVSENSGMTLLDFVRYKQRLTGTKIGCREGDCGACTVLVGSLNENDEVTYQSITSCISPLGNAQGKHIVTVEGVNLDDKLSAVQQAMKDNYATQCGFCTPGFVIALTGFVISNNEKSTTTGLNAISGNICRCTGYKSIEKAVENVCNSVGETQSLEELINNNFIPEYFKNIPKRLKELNQPIKQQSGTNFISGGTDLYVQKADDLIESKVHLISEDLSLRGITIRNGMCYIGANTTVSDIWNNAELNACFPKLKKHLKLVSSEQIRNMASIGGNIVNASPIGDMTVFFLGLNSNLTIRNQKGDEREISLKSFFKGYKTFDLEKGEIIKCISFKLPTNSSVFNFEKVCKRTHLDIASVNAAMQITFQNDTISDVNASIGGVAAIPKYLHKTSAFLNNKELSVKLILEANKILQEEIAPISDVRGSSEYKRLLARQLFFAHFIELFPELFTLNDFVQYAK